MKKDLSEKDKKFEEFKKEILKNIKEEYDKNKSSFEENDKNINKLLENEEIEEKEIEKVIDEFIRNDNSENTLVKNIQNKFNLAIKLRNNPEVATHYGDDLDNRSSIYVVENWAKKNGIIEEDKSLKVERIPAGQIKQECVNIDTGGHKGSNYIGDTIVIDGDPKNGIKSSIQELSGLLDEKVPKQILECADAMPTKISIFDTKSGMSLHKFTDVKNVFKMAENGLLTRELTDEELEEYNLKEAYNTQQKIVDDAVEKVNKYTKELANGEKVVIAPEFIKSGSIVAYESGINYYASVDKHLDSEKNVDGSTFAINAKPGVNLPDNIKEFGCKLVEKYKNSDGTSGVFLHPNGSVLVAGGPKNPDFKVDMSQEEIINKVDGLFTEYGEKEKIKSQINEQKQKMEELIDKNKEQDLQEMKAKDLKNEVERAYKEKEQKNNKNIGE